MRVALDWRDDRVELRVSDTGVGIADADLPRMFERFHRVKHARARTHEGTGIGLALVQELARLHGGTVAVESQEGRGTTFTVSIRTGTAHLPADRIAAARRLASTSIGAIPYVEEALRWLPDDGGASAGSPRTPSRRTAAALVPDAAPRVLVADDNADMRDYLTSHPRPALSRRGGRRRARRARSHRGRSARSGADRRDDADARRLRPAGRDSRATSGAVACR